MNRALKLFGALPEAGGHVKARLYPRMGHTVNRDELRSVQAMMAALT